MALPSVAELGRLFDDEDLAREAHAAEVLASWPSLRVLAALSESEEATTGELARAVNMDMSEVRDHLDALAELGVVAESDGVWELTTQRARLDIEMDERLRVSHALDGEGPTTEDSDATEPGGLIARLRRWLSGG